MEKSAITPQSWTERLVLHRGWRSARTGLLAGMASCLLMAAVQVVLYMGSREAWRLWAASSFVLLSIMTGQEAVFYRLLLRLEQELRCGPAGGAGQPENGAFE